MRRQVIENFMMWRVKVLYPKDAKLLRISPYYKKIFVDEDDMEIDSKSPNFDKRKEKIVIEYPIEVSNYFFLNGVRENKNVKIAYPVQNLNIFVPKILMVTKRWL